MVLNAGLGVRDALVEGKGGSFVSVMVRSAHHNIVPHITAPRGLFGCDVRAMADVAIPGVAVTCGALLSCVSRARTALSKRAGGGWALNRCFAGTFGTAAVPVHGRGGCTRVYYRVCLQKVSLFRNRPLLSKVVVFPRRSVRFEALKHEMASDWRVGCYDC